MIKKSVGTAYKSSTAKRTKPRSKIKYIASVETSNNNRREQWALTAAEAGFRMGVLNERKTQAKIYCRENGIKSKARKHKK